MKKTITFILSMILVINCTVLSFANTFESENNYGIFKLDDSFDIQFAENGIPIETFGSKEIIIDNEN